MSKPKVRDSMYKSETSQVVAGLESKSLSLLEIGNDELKETRNYISVVHCLNACLPAGMGGVLDTKCQMPKLQSGYNGCVVHTRSTANVVDQKKQHKKRRKKRQISCRQLMFCDPLETRPELSIKQTYYYGRTVDVMTEY